MKTNRLSQLLVILVWSLVTLASCSDEEAVQSLQQENDALKEQIQMQEDKIVSLSLGRKFVDRYVDSLKQLDEKIRNRAESARNDATLQQDLNELENILRINSSIMKEVEQMITGGDRASRLLMTQILKLNEAVQAQEREIVKLYSDLDQMEVDLVESREMYSQLRMKFTAQELALQEKNEEIKALRS